VKRSGPDAARSPADLTLGIDLGTSAIKVTALRLDDEPAGEASAGYETLSSAPLMAEQSPADWIEALRAAMRRLAEELGTLDGGWATRIAAIGVTGQLPTLVCLGNEGPVARAITWKDGRADAWAATRITRGDHYSRTGMPIDGRYLGPMWQFHFAQRMAEVVGILSAKDYLLHVLTGERVTEPSTAAGYGVYDIEEHAFARDLCDFWHLPARVLPEVRPAGSLAGTLHAAGAALLGLPAGIPVSTGAADSACAAYAMAGFDERITSVSFGSSAVIFAATRAPRLDAQARYLVTPHVQAGWYGREMDLLASGTGYRWLSDLFGWDECQIDRFAAESTPGARGVLFAPYLGGGEQGALWNPSLRGALLGLELSSGRADIARAYLEGVFFEVRRCIEVLAEHGPMDSVRVAGRVAEVPSSLAMLCDILDRPVSPYPDRSPAATGAARLARRLLGENAPGKQGHASPSTKGHASATTTGGDLRGPKGHAPPGTRAPDPSLAAIYKALYPVYLARSAACG
jgi:xylulokinase